MTTIHATGTSSTKHRAERATISAHISVTEESRSDSITKATNLHNSLLARAKQLAERGEAGRYEADPISTYARNSFGEGSGSGSETRIEYTTSSIVRIELTNLEIVSELVLELAEAGAQTSVSWSLTEASREQHLRTARKAAVTEARSVADDYAQALGETVESVTSISDTREGSFGAAPRFAMADMAHGASAEITIAEIEVTASVVGVFESR